MKDKNLTITIGITFVLFSFIIFLMYLIYCYSYYDNRKSDIFLENYNKDAWDFVYDNWEHKEEIEKESFYNSMNIMYDKNFLRNIYDTYYKANSKMTFEMFSNQYYFGDSAITKNKIIFATEGKTNLINRKKFYYKNVNLENKNGYTTRLGIFHNIKLEVPNNGTINFDNQACELKENICEIPVVFGGLHKVLYSYNGIKYFALLNIYSDNMEVDVTTIDGLIKYIEGQSVKGVTVTNKEDAFVSKGSYRVSACYLPSSCPNSRESYLILNEDGTCTLYIYITLDVSRDTYNGTYRINEDFIYLSFDRHIYNVFDYDTKEADDIEVVTDMKMSFKIEDANNLKNDKYKFTYVG